MNKLPELLGLLTRLAYQYISWLAMIFMSHFAVKWHSSGSFCGVSAPDGIAYKIMLVSLPVLYLLFCLAFTLAYRKKHKPVQHVICWAAAVIVFPLVSYFQGMLAAW